MSNEWQALEAHYKKTGSAHMRDLFAQDEKRFDRFHATLPGLTFDYSRHRANEETIALLVKLARAAGLEEWRKKMFRGEVVNISENRAALHPALRGTAAKGTTIDGEDVAEFVRETLQKIKNTSGKIRADKNITDVIAIGIGGSELGPRMVCTALQSAADGPRIHFASNIDGEVMTALMKNLNPAKTALVIVSKTFTTQETMANAGTAKKWLGASGGSRIFAVTADTGKAESFGVSADNVLPMRSWIGGRTSLWSAAGLPIAIAGGFDAFSKLLEGAHAADTHFLSAPPEKNIPVLMAILGVWYRNFHDFRAHAVIPYAEDLRDFPPYIQQLDMESNGKSVTRDGKPMMHATGPVLFGGPGTGAQHAFFQLLHQGTDIVPCDFIIPRKPMHSLQSHHDTLTANALAQAQSLMHGHTNPDEPHRNFAGNRPSSTFIIDRLDAFHLGLLAALYEHKIFVQGVLWGINSFDQWGVELGKSVAAEILDNQGRKTPENSDYTTVSLMKTLGRTS